MSARVGYSIWQDELGPEALAPLLDEAAAMDADTVELPLFALGLILGGRLREADAARLSRHLDGYRFGRTLHGLIAVNLMEAPGAVPLHEEMARLNIDAAACLGAERLILHAGTTPDREDVFAEGRARQREIVARLGDAASAAGVLLCIETATVDPGQRTLLAEELAEDIGDIGHPAVTATLDFAHVALECTRRGADPLAGVARLLPLAAHLHLNDCFARPCARGALMPAEALAFGFGDLHLPIGWGALPWDDYLALPGWRDDAILNLELHTRHWDMLRESLRQVRSFAARTAGPSIRRAAP